MNSGWKPSCLWVTVCYQEKTSQILLKHKQDDSEVTFNSSEELVDTSLGFTHEGEIRALSGLGNFRGGI